MSELKEHLDAYRDGDASLEETVKAINESFFQVASDATIDVDRHWRTGSAEVIYAERKTPDQVASAFQTLADSGNNVLATRVYPEAYDALAKLTPTASYNQVARVASLVQNQPVTPETSIAVVTAGTSDLAVAEEASATPARACQCRQPARFREADCTGRAGSGDLGDDCRRRTRSTTGRQVQ